MMSPDIAQVAIDEMLREAVVLANLRHPNVLCLYAICLPEHISMEEVPLVSQSTAPPAELASLVAAVAEAAPAVAAAAALRPSWSDTAADAAAQQERLRQQQQEAAVGALRKLRLETVPEPAGEVQKDAGAGEAQANVTAEAEGGTAAGAGARSPSQSGSPPSPFAAAASDEQTAASANQALANDSRSPTPPAGPSEDAALAGPEVAAALSENKASVAEALIRRPGLVSEFLSGCSLSGSMERKADFAQSDLVRTKIVLDTAKVGDKFVVMGQTCHSQACMYEPASHMRLCCLFAGPCC